MSPCVAGSETRKDFEKKNRKLEMGFNEMGSEAVGTQSMLRRGWRC